MINPKFAFRLLARTPFVSGVAIASLALGIGANAAIFSVVNQMLLRPLPVAHPAQLVNFAAPGPNPGSQSCGMPGDCTEVFSYAMFRDLQHDSAAFSGIAAHVPFGANLSAHGQTLSGQGVLVSGNYFSVLGVRPALGRLFDNGDDAQIAGARVTVLSYAYWQSTLGGSPAILNQQLIVNGQPLTVIGVAAPDFTSTTLGLRPQVFVPITLRSLMVPGWNQFDKRTTYFLYLFGRLKPGVTLQRAQSVINVHYAAIINNVEASLQQGMSATTMTKFRAKKIVLRPGEHGQSSVFKQSRGPLTLLFAVTVVVLLIACANIANLLLARSATRSGEMALRLAIGGSRGQLLQQLMFESLLLAAIGGILGLAVARATLGAMAALLPNRAVTFAVHLDPAIILFAAVVTLFTAFGFGLFPALFATRSDLITALRASSGQPSGGRTAARWRTGLATAQVALSMALLASAGLFARSLQNISRVDLGVQVDHLVTFGLSPELNGYHPDRTVELFHRVEDQLATLPGVTQVSAALVPLLAGSNWGNDVDVDGFPSGPDVDNNSRFNEVGTGYFSTTGVPMLAGREFTRNDALTAPKVAIINQAFARKFHLGTNPVGKRMDQGNKKLDIEIIGLARDAKYSQVKDSVPPIFFIPYTQDDGIGSASFYVKTTGDPAQLLRSIPRKLSQLDPNLPVEDLRTMPDQVRDNVFLDRFIGTFSALFAGLATLLAAIGLYGVLSYTVAQRTREIGVRMALGAAPGQVRAMVLRQVGLMTLAGGVIGIVAAVAIGRLAQSLLYQMNGANIPVFVGAAIALTTVALVSGLLPAHRAASVDPIGALRHD